MIRTFSFDGELAERTLTVKCLREAKGKRKLVQTTATSQHEAASAAAAGIEMITGPAPKLAELRAGAPHLFITVGVQMWKFAPADQVLREAYRLLEAGADAIYCPREPQIIEMLANARVPVMAHLGLVPRVASWTGGARAAGKTAEEAIKLFQQYKEMESAGAVMVESEVIAADVLTEITKRVTVSTVSLGSGPGGDIDYMFQVDVTGEKPDRPRHSRAFANLHSMQQAMDAERVRALAAYKASVEDGSFPSEPEIVGTAEKELGEFVNYLERSG